MAREEMMSDQQVPVPVPPCKLIPPLPVHEYHTLRSGSQGEKQKSRQSVHHSEVQVDLFCLVCSTPKWQKDLWTLTSLGHGSLDYP
jgi:hypothetical protein